jgi:hypothetical protein
MVGINCRVPGLQNSTWYHSWDYEGETVLHEIEILQRQTAGLNKNIRTTIQGMGCCRSKKNEGNHAIELHLHGELSGQQLEKVLGVGMRRLWASRCRPVVGYRFVRSWSIGVSELVEWAADRATLVGAGDCGRWGDPGRRVSKGPTINSSRRL